MKVPKLTQFSHWFPTKDLELCAESFAKLLDTKKVGVCYLAKDHATGCEFGHCVIYQLVLESTTRISAPGKWRFIDYQADPRGKDVSAEVLAGQSAMVFAVEPAQGDATASFGRPAL